MVYRVEEVRNLRTSLESIWQICDRDTKEGKMKVILVMSCRSKCSVVFWQNCSIFSKLFYSRIDENNLIDGLHPH